MGQQATAKRRRKQAKNNYNHLSGMGVPHYPARSGLDVHMAIQRERQKAARIAAASTKKK